MAAQSEAIISSSLEKCGTHFILMSISHPIPTNINLSLHQYLQSIWYGSEERWKHLSYMTLTIEHKCQAAIDQAVWASLWWSCLPSSWCQLTIDQLSTTPFKLNITNYAFGHTLNWLLLFSWQNNFHIQPKWRLYTSLTCRKQICMANTGDWKLGIMGWLCS